MYSFIIFYKEEELFLNLAQNNTVEDIKLHIWKKFDIRPAKQIITGWDAPTSDNAALKTFLDGDEHILWVVSMEEEQPTSSSGWEVDDESTSSTEFIEIEASYSFLNKYEHKYGTQHIQFFTDSLRNILSKNCFTSIQSKKVILLYLYNENDKFTKIFSTSLIKGEMRTILEKSFVFLGWDINNDQYHDALIKSVGQNVGSSFIEDFVRNKTSTIFVLFPIQDCVAVKTALVLNKIKLNDVVTFLKNIAQGFKNEIQNEVTLEDINQRVNSENDINSKNFQQLMYDRLSDRDYDGFTLQEHVYLKDKIGFTIFGPPQNVNGYDDMQKKKIEETYKKICEQSNQYSEFKNYVVVSFIYNCLEPLPNEKLKRAQQYHDYNPNTDIAPIPIYVLRKCMGSKHPCRIFIDENNRVYNSWENYIEDNKLHECLMVLPLIGRYTGNNEGRVMLEKHLSPACSISRMLLRGTDIASSVAGVASAGVFIAAMIPAITVAPVVLVSAGVVGAAVGVYSIIRSAFALVDRHQHDESLSFANSEARGAYFNIVAGTVGFVGAGATTIVSQLAARGYNIGQGTRIVVNTIGITNIGVSGATIANSTYQVLDDWLNEQRTPSFLTMLQLSSSILFFGNAVYNFRSAATIIDEAQTNALKNYQDSLRSNRHRRTFNKLMKETLAQNNGDHPTANAEIISTVRSIGNRDEVFAILTRNNKLFNKKGIRFAVQDGEIKLNGVSVDLFEFGGMSKTDRTQILIDLPPRTRPLPTNATTVTNSLIESTFTVDNLRILGKYSELLLRGASFRDFATNLLGDFSKMVQGKIFTILKGLIEKLKICGIDIAHIFDTTFALANKNPYSNLLQWIVDYLKIRMNDYESDYQSSESSEVPSDTYERAKFWIEKIVNSSVMNYVVEQNFMNELLKFVANKITEYVYDFCNLKEKEDYLKKSCIKRTKRVDCSICGGYYFM